MEEEEELCCSEQNFRNFNFNFSNFSSSSDRWSHTRKRNSTKLRQKQCKVQASLVKFSFPFPIFPSHFFLLSSEAKTLPATSVSPNLNSNGSYFPFLSFRRVTGQADIADTVVKMIRIMSSIFHSFSLNRREQKQSKTAALSPPSSNYNVLGSRCPNNNNNNAWQGSKQAHILSPFKVFCRRRFS